MNVRSWLDGIPHEIPPQQILDSNLESDDTGFDLAATARAQSRKRKRPMPTPTPSASHTPSRQSKRSKRRRDEYRDTDDAEDTEDNDATPRSRPPPTDSGLSRDSASSADTESQRSSSQRSRMSPTKRLLHLQIAADPVVVKQMNISNPAMPDELRWMLLGLDPIRAGVGVVPRYLAAAVQERKDARDLNFYSFAPHTFEEGGSEISPPPAHSHLPPLDLAAVMDIALAAEACAEELHAEASWNALVHWPLFRLALGALREPYPAASSSGHPQAPPPSDGQDRVRVRAMPCTTARLRRTPSLSQGKMVDYCVYVDPSMDSAEGIAIDARLRRGKPINHTDYAPLQRRPVVLSAESKKPGEGYLEAHVQVGIWQAAQWSLLEAQMGDNTEAKTIPFLPALVIHGHEWAFTATTRSEGKTTKKAVGAIDSLLGIFQIVHALRYIKSWIRGQYWPLYKASVLGILDKGEI
ncbi:hypothetical protein GGR56DRAFT_661213 [Xylariaceae sp. FL0804]|nr:hypothetical protein GGR56DRAFT_661213 [Xylariaceae sp. FL0804]